jgi:hypothetical protein
VCGRCRHTIRSLIASAEPMAPATETERLRRRRLTS